MNYEEIKEKIMATKNNYKRLIETEIEVCKNNPPEPATEEPDSYPGGLLKGLNRALFLIEEYDKKDIPNGVTNERNPSEIQEELRDLQEIKAEQEAFGVKDFATKMAMQSTKKRERKLLLEQARKLVDEFNPSIYLEADWFKNDWYQLRTDGVHAVCENWWTLNEFIEVARNTDAGKVHETEAGKRLGFCLEAAALLPKLIAALEEQ